MLTTLRTLLGVLGLSAILIALSILLLGAETTAGSAERVFAALAGWRGAPSGPWPPTMDSELRFYAALWGAYGALLIVTAWRWPDGSRWVPWLAAVFFAGGVGRAISYVAIGAPHPFFSLLMWIELLLPPVLVALWWRWARPPA